MSDLNDIYLALMNGKRAIEALGTWVRTVEGRDSVRNYMASVQDGIAAYERLQGDLRNGSKHVEPPDDYVLTNCGCGDPNARPPCSWCTTSRDEEETP